MKNQAQCYVCYDPIEENGDDIFYHKRCLNYLFQTDSSPEIFFDEKDIQSLAKSYINKKMGIPGVQRKLSVALEKTKSESDNYPRLTLVGYLDGHYILKPPAEDYPFMPELEDLTMHLAELANFQVAAHGLVKLKSGHLAYITKRFDRVKDQKIAVEDLCQLSLKRTEDKYKSSSEKCGKIIQYYSSQPGDDCLTFFELIFFSFLVGNADMHLKNFSFITDDVNNIHLAPCYDLLSTKLLIPSDLDELALTINGKHRNLKKKDFLLFGKSMSISEKVLCQSMDKLMQYFLQWKLKIKTSFVPIEYQSRLIDLIQSRIDQMK